MALSGTDYFAHLVFQQQAERYRRQFVQQMNHDMEVHSQLGDWDYKAGDKLFASVDPFVFSPPNLLQSTRHYLPGLLSLIIWGAAVFFLITRYPVYLN
jgi:ABC-2 type transport system permease protein